MHMHARWRMHVGDTLVKIDHARACPRRFPARAYDVCGHAGASEKTMAPSVLPHKPGHSRAIRYALEQCGACFKNLQ